MHDETLLKLPTKLGLQNAHESRVYAESIQNWGNCRNMKEKVTLAPPPRGTLRMNPKHLANGLGNKQSDAIHWTALGITIKLSRRLIQNWWPFISCVTHKCVQYEKRTWEIIIKCLGECSSIKTCCSLMPTDCQQRIH